MTDPTDGFDRNDELTEALRRDLRSSVVPFDDEQADEMISQATQARLVDARRWNAPLAAAAAVVLVGGGAAIVAANVGNGHHTGTPAADGAGPYVSACSTYGPLPSDEPTPSAIASAVPPSATSTATPIVPEVSRSAPPSEAPSPSSALSTSAVPSGPVPSESPSASGPSAARVRIGPTPSVVFPVVVSPGNAVLTETASPVPQAPPSTPDPSASDPCVGVIGSALPSAIASPVVVPVPDTPTVAPSTTPAGVTPSGSASGSESGSASPSYEPPIPPVPTESGETNAAPIVVKIDSDAGGTVTQNISPLRSDAKFVTTELVFHNNAPGTTGTVTLQSSGASLLTLKLQDYDRLDYHLDDEPLTFTGHGDKITLNCTGTAACDTTVTLVGDYVAR